MIVVTKRDKKEGKKGGWGKKESKIWRGSQNIVIRLSNPIM